MRSPGRAVVLSFVLVTRAALAAAQEPAGQRATAEVRKLDLDSMRMSDPFILADPFTRLYYMTGSGGAVWRSPDLRTWEGPYRVVRHDTSSWMGPNPAIWAAELRRYQGRYYYFAAFTNRNIIVDTVPGLYEVQRRASHVLMSGDVMGPYRPIGSEGYLPEKWSALDGTLWVEDGVPYMVFCHEWMQVVDGTMELVRLAPDLSRSIGEPATLFRASDAPWSREMNSIGEVTFGMRLGGQVTDGPYLFRTQTGRLGMLFRTFEGKLLMSLHHANLEPGAPGGRKPVLLEVDDAGDRLRIIGRYQPAAGH